MAQITNLINNLNRNAQVANNAARIPGATDLEAISSANIRSGLEGELPAGVLNLLKQQAAERGVAGGFGGSPNETAAFLRALGLTSLDLTKQAQQDLTSALGRNPAAPVWDPSKLVLGAGEAQEIALRQEQLALQAAEIASQNALRDAQRRNEISTTSTPWWVTAPGTTTWIPGAAGGGSYASGPFGAYYGKV